jgi:hypothetical protein
MTHREPQAAVWTALVAQVSTQAGRLWARASGARAARARRERENIIDDKGLVSGGKGVTGAVRGDVEVGIYGAGVGGRLATMARRDAMIGRHSYTMFMYYGRASFIHRYLGLAVLRASCVLTGRAG